MRVIQYSVVIRRRGSADRDRTPDKRRPLLLLAFAPLRGDQLTVLGLFTDREGGPRCAC